VQSPTECLQLSPCQGISPGLFTSTQVVILVLHVCVSGIKCERVKGIGFADATLDLLLDGEAPLHHKPTAIDSKHLPVSTHIGRLGRIDPGPRSTGREKTRSRNDSNGPCIRA
jgi:hypothetical protein